MTISSGKNCPYHHVLQPCFHSLFSSHPTQAPGGRIQKKRQPQNKVALQVLVFCRDQENCLISWHVCVKQVSKSGLSQNIVIPHKS